VSLLLLADLHSTTAAMGFTMFVLVNTLQGAVEEIHLLSLLIQMQRIDAKYSSYDFSQPSHVCSYLSEIIKHLPDDENKPEDVDVFSKVMEHLMHISPELHRVLRDELEKFHSLLAKDLTKDPVDTAEAVLEALVYLSGNLMTVWQWAQGLHRASQANKEKKADGEDTYEVVG